MNKILTDYIIEDLESLANDFKNLEKLANKLCKTTQEKRFNLEDVNSLIHKINFCTKSINDQSKVIKSQVTDYIESK
tara:strand:+ start:589 stop:819 length:231 start_codon:yes stop_codon:yes gene_type:complete